MKFDPRHLSIIAAIVDKGGLSEAAEFLGKSQPSVSRSLALLEQRVGEKLFIPNKRPLSPTALGKVLADSGRKVMGAEKNASKAFNQFKRGRFGVVKIGGTPFLMDGVVSSRIADFQQTNSDVRIEQSYGYGSELISGVHNGTLDVAVCPLQPTAIPADLAFTPVMPGRNIIACRVGHPLLRRAAITINDLCDFPWIAPPEGSPLHLDLRATLTEMGAKDYRVSFTGGSLGSVLNVLAGSESLTILPFSVIFAQKKKYGVTSMRMKVPHPDRTVGLITPKNATQTPVVQHFHKHLVNVFKTLSQTIAFSEKSDMWRP